MDRVAQPGGRSSDCGDMRIHVGRRAGLVLAALTLILVGADSGGHVIASKSGRVQSVAVAGRTPTLVSEPVLADSERVAARPKAPQRPARLAKQFAHPYAAFARQKGRRAWWNRPSGVPGGDWVYPYFPTACYQADRRAGGTNASAWQLLWVYPDNAASTLAPNLDVTRLAIRGAQSLFAASAGRYIRNRAQLFTHSLAPRFVTTTRCQADVRAVRVPAVVFNTGHVWSGDPSATPFGAGTVTEWLLKHGYKQPNRKYLVVLQSSPSYTHYWAGISENLAAQAGRAGESPSLDNPANYTSYSFLDASWVFDGRSVADAAYPAQLIAHEMTHALGAMTESAPHDSRVNPLHPTDCWDLLCSNPPTGGQTYSNGCGTSRGWMEPRIARGYLRLDCNRDDYWAPATDGGLRAATWTRVRWAVSSSSFLYGNPQPTRAQLLAHQR